ncbi:MAG: hypothetical protein HN704_14985 [Bacteroidetes bacterium]|jgi:potassium/hydrogen antiporter|nr:hypothetical protein [Bacteroidota bacterium]MBT6686132.1 hypothetical protein [Bacteroidota bacterium]MBT7144647.1 hypothetical protein [Bacteroidota bacterium]MBT7492902.1 hypothetical protein [Bacteroidota bacterium]
MEILNTYSIIISASLIIIISYLFNIISARTNIPSVILLIVLGIVLKILMNALEFDEIDFFPVLKILGTIGLIMIVLEASLDLELKKGKMASNLAFV